MSQECESWALTQSVIDLEEAKGNTVPLEVYEAAVSGKFRVVKCNYEIGGHFLVFDRLVST